MRYGRGRTAAEGRSRGSGRGRGRQPSRNAAHRSLPELATRQRLIVSPDGELHQLPFDLLPGKDGRRLLESHVVSYVPSGSVLTVLRSERAAPARSRRALAVSASPPPLPASLGPARPSRAICTTWTRHSSARCRRRTMRRGRSERILGPETTTVLLGERATESELKRQPLQDFQVLHFAVHGIPSTKFPARAALLLQPAGADDGVLQAREILMLRLNADLVTLSACDTGSGSVHGQEGAASLVRPFLAAGARTVVANLWAADDTFSLTLMREFYRRLAAGADVANALRDAKLQMLESFGPQALPRLWSGVLVYGDGEACLQRQTATPRGGIDWRVSHQLSRPPRRPRQGPDGDRHEVHGAGRRHQGPASEARVRDPERRDPRGVRGGDERAAQRARRQPHGLLPRGRAARGRPRRPGRDVHEGGNARRPAMGVSGRASRRRRRRRRHSPGRRAADDRRQGARAAGRRCRSRWASATR